MSDPVRSAVNELFASRESTLRSASFAADASARSLIRRRRAVRQVGSTAAVLVGIIALGAGAVAAVNDGVVGPFGATEPETYVSVAYNEDAVDEALISVNPLPGCGEPADIEPRSQHGLSITVALREHEEDGDGVSFDVGFRNDGSEHLTFIASTRTLLLVKDGVVDSEPTVNPGPLTSFDAAPGHSNPQQDRPEFDYIQTCEGMEAWLEFRDERPTEPMTPEEDQEWSERTFEFAKTPLAPGEYTMYAWTPVLFGEQAGVGRVWRESGQEFLDSIGNPGAYDSPLFGDESLTEYCFTEVITADTNEVIVLEGVLPTGDDGWPTTVEGEPVNPRAWGCDVPQDILDEKLVRLVPERYINDYELTYIVSEPITFTVE